MAQRNYNGERFRTITKAELIEALSDLNDDDLVIFTSDYGDYHHTDQALSIRGEVEEVRITKSGYSHSGFQLMSEGHEGRYIDEEDESGEMRDEDGEPLPKYYVIR